MIEPGTQHQEAPAIRTPVRRRHLDARFDALRVGAAPAIAVWAPAGAGKTTLLEQWSTALREGGATVVRASGRSTPTEIVTALTLAEQATQRGFLVLDDAHLVADAALRRRLVEATVDGTISFIVAGRYEPFTPSLALSLSPESLEVRADELAFSLAETDELLSRSEVRLGDRSLSTLHERTGGWVTGLVLAAQLLSTSDEQDHEVEAFDGDHRAVGDYLMSELLARLDVDDIEVLLRAAVADTVPLALAVQTTGRADAGAVLDRLARHNLLLLRGRNEYSFHPVLRAYLDAEATRRDSRAAHERHVVSARWFALDGRPGDALAQALQSRSRVLLIETLERVGIELVCSGHAASVLRAIRSLGTSVDEPIVHLIHLLLSSPGFPDRIGARHLLMRLEQTLVASPDPRLQAWTGVLWTMHDRVRRAESRHGAPDGEHRGAAPFGTTGTGSHAFAVACGDDPMLAIVALICDSWSAQLDGRMSEGTAGLAEAAASAHSAGALWLELVALDLAAMAMATQGRWTASHELTDDAVARCLVSDNEVPADWATARALVARGFIHYQRCEPVATAPLRHIATDRPLGSDETIAVLAQTTALLASIDDGRASGSRAPDAGRYEDAATWLRLHAFTGPTPFLLSAAPWLSTALRSGHRADAKLILAAATSFFAGSLEEPTLQALAALSGATSSGCAQRLAAAVDAGTPARGVTTPVLAHLALAGFAERAGSHVLADEHVRCALEASQQLRLIRPFLLFGGLGAELIRSRLGRLGRLESHAQTIIALAEPAASRPATGGIPIPLTVREMELLAELPPHQSIGVIATKLGLSANTVKTHLKNVYQKLGADSRSHAVEIAQQRGLL